MLHAAPREVELLIFDSYFYPMRHNPPPPIASSNGTLSITRRWLRSTDLCLDQGVHRGGANAEMPNKSGPFKCFSGRPV